MWLKKQKCEWRQKSYKNQMLKKGWRHLIWDPPNRQYNQTHTLTFHVCVLKNFSCRAIATPCYRRHFTLFVVSFPRLRYVQRVMRKKAGRSISFAQRRESWVIAAWVLSIWEGEWKIKKKKVWRYHSMRGRTAPSERTFLRYLF